MGSWQGTQFVSIAVSGAMMLVGGAAMALLGPRMFPPEVPGPEAVPGRVGGTASVAAPLSDPVVTGHVRVQGIRTTGGERHWDDLYSAPLAPTELPVEVQGQLRTVQLPPWDWEDWEHCRPETTKPDTLAGSGLEDLAKGWRDERYHTLSVQVFALRPGDPVLLEGPSPTEVERLWCGTRAEIEASERDMQRNAQRMFGIGGGVMALLGLPMGLLGLWLLRTSRRTRPEPGAPAVEWVHWTLDQRSASWAGTLDGRVLVAQRAHRDGGVGPAMLYLGCAAATRVAVLHREGRAARLGRTVDKLAGVKAHDGERYGLDGLEVSCRDPEWCEAWLTDDAVHSALIEVLGDAAGASGANVSVRPGYVSLILPGVTPAELEPHHTQRWLDALVAMAVAAERLGPPADPMEPTRMDALALDPARTRRVVWAALLGFCLVVVLVFAAVMLLALKA